MSGQSADQDDGGQAEGYLVSVSDLMVGLLFVFIMILVAFALLLRQTESSAGEDLPGALGRLYAEVQTRDTQIEQERSSFGRWIDEAESVVVDLRGQLAVAVRDLDLSARKVERLSVEADGFRIEAERARVEAVRARIEVAKEKDAAERSKDEADRARGEAARVRIEAAQAKDDADRARMALAALQVPLPAPRSMSSEVSEGLRICQDQRAGLLRDIQSRLRQRKVEDASIDASTGVLRLSEKALYFEPRVDSLPTSGVQRDVVRAVADTFAETLPCFTASGRQARDCAPTTQPIIDAVFVEGHTDRRPFRITPGKDENYGLSARRALNVYELMKRDQPGLWDLRNRETFAIMGMSGYGPERPVPGRTADTEEDWAANRRIEFRFLLDPLPCSRL
jgi:chemotaxis protein MotB